MKDDAAYGVLTTTLADAEAATALARALVEAGIAACVQIVAVRSLYRWQGAVAEDVEHRLDAKIAAADFDAAAAFIRERHPYEVPEIVMAPITAADRAYLDWLAASTRRQDIREEVAIEGEPRNESGGARKDAAVTPRPDGVETT